MSGKKQHMVMAGIVLFVACLPLFTVNCIGGHDITYHLLRIEALKTGILAGRPFLRINMLFFGGMGYASSLFYPDFLLYFPAVLRALGVGINLSYHLFIALCIISGFLSSYFCARYVSKSSYAALITAIIFTLYQYHIDDIYTRSAVGEFTAAIFIPFVIAGLYDFLFEEYKKPWLLFIGMSGVLLCHTITTVVCVGLCVLAVIADIGGIIKTPKKIIRLLLTAVLVLGFTAFYWMPVLEMLATGTVSNEFTYDAAYESVKLWDIFDNEFNCMGIAIFLLLLPRLIVKPRERFADMCAGAGLIVAICATAVFPWERIERYISFIQFPWRLFVASGPLLAFAEGIYIDGLIKEPELDEKRMSFFSRTLLVFVAGIMLASALINLERNDQKYYSYSDDYFDYLPYTAEVIGGEWVPTTVENRGGLIYQSEAAFLDDGTEIAVNREKNELEVDGIPEGSDYIDVPFVYYKGYAAENKDTGERLPVMVAEDRNGCVRVYLNGAAGIRVYYKGTAAQHISDAISIGFLTGIIIYIIIKRQKKKLNPESLRETPASA